MAHMASQEPGGNVEQQRQGSETPHEVTWDGQTVWVNGIDGLLGRFNTRRMDVHADNQCERCGPGTWEGFVAAMKDIHGVEVPPEAKAHNRRGRS